MASMKDIPERQWCRFCDPAYGNNGDECDHVEEED